MTSNRRHAVSSGYGAIPTAEDRVEFLGHAAGLQVQEQVDIGYQVFTSDGGEECGAVRDVYPDALIVYVENAGDFRVPFAAVQAVHFQKVILTCAKLGRSLRRAIGHAHDGEVPGA